MDADAVADAVAAVLERSGGLARRRDLVKAGLSRRELERRVRRGQLRPMTPHLFTDTDQPRPDDALRQAVVSLDAVVSHTSAALLWGLELGVTPTERTVTVSRTRTRLQQHGVSITRRDLGPDELEHRDGLRVTTVLRTVLDLCRSLPLVQAVQVADSALRRGLLTVDDLEGALVAMPAARGRASVGAVVALVDPASGSVLESALRVLLALHGMRPPSAQLSVYAPDAGLIGRVDFAWPELQLVVEADGYAFHRDRRRYREDRRRGNALVRAGWTVLRFSYEDVLHYPDHVVQTVRVVLGRLAVRAAA